MTPMLRVVTAGLAIACGATASPAQAAPHGHLITGRLIDKPNARFAFDPDGINAQRGETGRFVQASSARRNVSFRKHPKTAALGAASVGPYLVTAGQTYDLVIDARFPDGTYTFTCDPHESIGMGGTLIVGPPK